MKRKYLRILTLILATVLIISQIAGCKRNTDDDNNIEEVPEFVYYPAYAPMPGGLGDIGSITVVGDRMYFASLKYDEETYTQTTSLYSMNFDLTDLQELENYSQSSRPVNIPEDATSYSWIVGLYSGGESDSELLLIERSYYYGYDVPEYFDPETDYEWNYYQDYGEFTTIRKLDSTGAEMARVELSDLAEGNDYFYINTVAVDAAGNIYAGSQQTIYVLDNEGKLKFKLEVPNWVNQLVSMPDGTVAHLGWEDLGYALTKIDYEARTFGEKTDLPQNVYNIYPAGGDYSFLYNNYTSLYGVDANTGEPVLILDWILNGIDGNNLSSITMLPDGKIIAANYEYDYVTYMPKYEIITLDKVRSDTLPELITLDIACFGMDWNLRNAIIQYNKKSLSTKISITDYQDFSTRENYMEGLTRLNTEIISGNVPDILLTSQLPLTQYASKGLLEDLYPFIDSDPDISRSDLMESIFRAAEINGGLYQIFPNFYISTLIGNPNVVGSYPGWNMDEFMEVINSNPQAVSPFGVYTTKSSYLENVLTMGMNDFVDWTAGKTYFDTGEFAKILEYANTFPEEFNYDNDYIYVSDYDLIMSGQQIISTFWAYDVRSIQMQKLLFGGEIVFKGYPSESRKGNVLYLYSGIAMTSSCKDKAAAWDFMKTILSEDWQRTYSSYQLPTNKNIFDEMLEIAMTPQYWTDEFGEEHEYAYTSWGWGTDDFIEIFALTQEEADLILSLIDSVSGAYSYDETLMTIVRESANEYFGGRSTAQDAARIIQSRASIYVAEQS